MRKICDGRWVTIMVGMAPILLTIVDAYNPETPLIILTNMSIPPRLDIEKFHDFSNQKERKVCITNPPAKESKAKSKLNCTNTSKVFFLLTPNINVFYYFY